MPFDKQKVINIALAEEGYLEKASRSGLDSKTSNAGKNNFTKYARDIDAITGFYNGKKQGVAWCDVFVDWCFIQAYGVDAALKLLCQPKKSAGAGCTSSSNYYRSKGRFFKTKPMIGDQIFFGTEGNVSHTGIVYNVDNNKVYTIEGNTSSASGVVANGGAVARKAYQLSYGRIFGYGRPDYGMNIVESKPVVKEEQKPVESVPKPSEQHEKQDDETYIIHTVAAGESLWSISKRYLSKGGNYKKIMRLNELEDSKIIVGMKLKIPKL